MTVSLQDPSAWARLAPYLDRALDLDINAREQWLAELATTQSDIARTVRELLREREELDEKGFLKISPIASTGPDFVNTLGEKLRDLERSATSDQRPAGLAENATLGAYRLVRELGAGGMSVVWLAERSDGQLRRQVAIKLPYADPRHTRLLDRFERERDILATLTHPNIARIYDAGVTDTGQPYLAMEYVDGVSLLRHCNSAALSLRDRLQLFIQVLGAVQFAHTHLIIHRDIKPSNILVAQGGRVVLLDFGIAKLLTDGESNSELTQAAGRPLTLDYASPEQIAGRPLGTASDVYSLGVVLFELMTGERPYRPKRDSRAALEEEILKTDPPRPSDVLSSPEQASARSTTPRKISAALNGDLDTIVLKALKKNPVERYDSVATFAQDVGNYLRDMPISARPDSTGYRFRKFISRHSLPVAASAIAVIGILVGGLAALWQARTAAIQRDRATVLAIRAADTNEFLGTVMTEAAASAKSVTVPDMLARSEQLALAGNGGSKENRAALLGSIASLEYTLGDPGKSAQLYERAIEVAGSTTDTQLTGELNCSYALSLSGKGQIEAAAKTIDQQLERLQSIPETASACLLYRHFVARRLGDAEGALKFAQQGLDRFYEAAKRNPGSVYQSAHEAIFLDAVGYGYMLNANNARANEYFASALRVFEQAGRADGPQGLAIRNNWAIVQTSAGMPKRGIELYDEMIRIVRENNPGVPPPPAMLHNRARNLELIGRYADAKTGFETARDISHQLKNVAFESMAVLGLASVSLLTGDRASTEIYLKQAREQFAPFAPETPQAMRMSIIEGRLASANEHYDQAREHFTPILAKKKSGPGTLDAAIAAAETELSAGRADAALEAANMAQKISTTLQGDTPYSNNTGLSSLLVGRALQMKGDAAAARKAFDVALVNLSNTVDEAHPALIAARKLAAEGK